MKKKEKLESILAMEVKDFLIEMVVARSTAVEKKTSASRALNSIILINKACTHKHVRHTHTPVYTHTYTHTQICHMYTYTHRYIYAHKSRHAFTVTCTHISAYTYTKHTLTSLERFMLKRLVQRN